MHGDASHPLLGVEGLDVAYPVPGLWSGWRGPSVRAVRAVSFDIAAGETLALVGESGSGKSTIARAVEGLVQVRSGTVRLRGRLITGPIQRRSADAKRRIQLIFQNPDASLNPRHTVATILSRPLAVFGNHKREGRTAAAAQLLADVQLDESYLGRRPAQLSGGERQRVAIARALAAKPDLILCDEILSALDVSVQASVLALLRRLQSERGLAYLFISHDLAVVRWLAHRVAVLFRGEICDFGAVEDVFRPPFHPYTEMLLAAVPRLGAPRVAPVAVTGRAEERGESLGCPFSGRCPRKLGPVCDDTRPPRQILAGGRAILCHIPVGDLARFQSQTLETSLASA